jgi:prepilin-type N-terminal cleavage/methylation domain-containing protein/prepilin-type processing-associated H-X9-DG protein
MFFFNERSAFTLIELLVVITIIAILAGVLLPAISLVKANAISTKCMSNLRQQNLAFTAYETDNGGLFPAPWASATNASQTAYWNTNLSVNYGAGKTSVDATDNDQTSGDGVFVEPLYRRRVSTPIATNRHLTGYGMNLYLPPSILGPTKTEFGTACNANPISQQIAERAFTILIAETTGGLYPVSLGWGAHWSVNSMNSIWHFENNPGYVHRTKANMLFVDGHVELRSALQAYADFTTTKAYVNNVTW